MANLATQSIALPSLLPQFTAAAAGGDTCDPGDTSFLVVKNGSGASINVTLDAKPDTSPWGATIPNHIVAVAAGVERWIGPLNGSFFRNPVSGKVDITYSAAASVTVGVFKI